MVVYQPKNILCSPDDDSDTVHAKYEELLRNLTVQKNLEKDKIQKNQWY
jgi:hypothetical protein